MTNMNEDFDEDEIPTAEDLAFEAKLRETEQHIRDLEQNGWTWHDDDRIKRVLCHPDDPEIHIWFNPYSGEQLLSPKLVERLKQTVHEERKDLPEA